MTCFYDVMLASLKFDWMYFPSKGSTMETLTPEILGSMYD